MSQAGQAGGSGGGGGTGTVTSFSFTDANGFDGTVTNPTTTPNLTLTTTVANTQVMFSNSGAIAGDSSLTYNSTTKQLNTGILRIPAATDIIGFISTDIGGVDTPVFGIYTNVNGSNSYVGSFPAVAATLTGVGNVSVGGGGAGPLFNLTSGSGNIGFGGSFLQLSTGNNNFGAGSTIALSLVSGSDNLFFGTAGNNYTSSESSNILFHNDGVVGESNTIRFGTTGTGSGQQSRCFIAGVAGVTTSNSRNVTIDNTTGQFGASASVTGTTVVTAPPNSASSTLALGTAFQNTSGHDVLLHVYIAVTAATTASILCGVGSSNTPTQQTIVSGLTLASLSIIPVTVYLPNSYYALISTSGTITASISGQQTTSV